HGAHAMHGIDIGLNGVAHTQLALDQFAVVTEHIGLNLLRVFDLETHTRSFEYAVIAHLAARFCIERRGIEHHDGLLTGRDRIYRRTVDIQRRDTTAALQRLIAFEAGIVALI